MKSIFRMMLILVACGAVSVQATDRYVAQNGQTPASPFTDWVGAASNIQAAINAAVAGDTVWVGPGRYTYQTNSVYDFYTNNVVYFYNKALAVRSSSGNPADTIIDGQGSNRCVLFGPNATSPAYPYVLDGFTVTNGFVTGNNSTRCSGIYIYN